MPRSLPVYRCLVISPSDVNEARDAAVEVIENWNAHIGVGLQARIEAVRWESHARPEMGSPAQDVINRQLVDDCDFGIAIFWSRLGSPTVKHPSGSAEEIERLLHRGSNVMVYFSNQPIPQDALKDDQYDRLQELKKRYYDQGLLATFDNISALREQFQLHLTSLVSELLLKSRAEGQPIPSTGTLTAPTPDIRVKVNFAFTTPDFYPILNVVIENHSPNDFYFEAIQFDVSDGRQMFVPQNFLTGEYVRSRTIEPGNSYSVSIDIAQVVKELAQSTIVAATARDKIGRIYRSDRKEMEIAINNFFSFLQRERGSR
jgi:hypothetical protein